MPRLEPKEMALHETLERIRRERPKRKKVTVVLEYGEIRSHQVHEDIEKKLDMLGE
jgi:hypothetical protein